MLNQVRRNEIQTSKIPDENAPDISEINCTLFFSVSKLRTDHKAGPTARSLVFLILVRRRYQ